MTLLMERMIKLTLFLGCLRVFKDFYILSAVFAEDLCRSTNTSQRNHWKCVWVLRGSRNLSESERDCEHNGGAVFTFDTVQEANYTLRVLGVESSTPLFVGAVLNMLNDTFYYDWLSRPGTWSLPTESNMSGDGKCLLFKDGGLEQKPCSSTMNITVCEKVMKSGCSCGNESDLISPQVPIKFQQNHHPLPTDISNSSKTVSISPISNGPDTDVQLTTPRSLGEPINISYSDLFNHVLTHANDSLTKDLIYSTIFDHVLSHTNGTRMNMSISGTDSESDLQSPHTGGLDKENRTANYCDVVDVLNITFGALIDKILGQGSVMSTYTTSCGRPRDVTETTVEQVEEKTTIPVTEVKFHFVSGLQKGPAMTGAKYQPPLRIDLHSKDYGILVNISRELMKFQSAKNVENDTLQSFAESVSNWTNDDRLTSKSSDVQSDLFEDILQIAEDLVGNISASAGDIAVSSGSIDILSTIVERSDDEHHTEVDMERQRKNIRIQLSNKIFCNESIKVRVSTVTYRGMDTILTSVDKRISSCVVSVSVKFITDGKIERQGVEEDDAIIFAMRTFVNKDKEEQQRLCTYWSFRESKWSTRGCSVVATNSTFTTCKCNHLTNFAILVMYLESNKISLHSQQVLFALTTVGCSVSIACLAMTLITYVYLRMLGNDKIMIHANLSLALLMAQIVFVSSSDAHEHKTACKVVAVLLHFLFMASFSWMMVEGIALYMTCTRGILANINREMKVKYFLIGWGFPAVIVIVSCAAQFPSYGDGPQYSCWLSTQNGLIWAFVGPMLVIVLLNICVMCLVVKVYLTLRANTEKSELARLRGSLRAMFTLLPLLGLGWILSLLVPLSVVFNYFFVIMNTLQGMCIFFLHCICNEEIRKMFREKRRRWSTTRTASDFDVAFHSRRKTGSFDGIRTGVTSITTENASRKVCDWILGGCTRPDFEKALLDFLKGIAAVGDTEPMSSDLSDVQEYIDRTLETS